MGGVGSIVFPTTREWGPCTFDHSDHCYVAFQSILFHIFLTISPATIFFAPSSIPSISRVAPPYTTSNASIATTRWTSPIFLTHRRRLRLGQRLTLSHRFSEYLRTKTLVRYRPSLRDRTTRTTHTRAPHSRKQPKHWPVCRKARSLRLHNGMATPLLMPMLLRDRDHGRGVRVALGIRFSCLHLRWAAMRER